MALNPKHLMQFLCKTPLNEVCSSAAVHRTKTTEKMCLGLTNRGSQVYMNVQTQLGCRDTLISVLTPYCLTAAALKRT